MSPTELVPQAAQADLVSSPATSSSPQGLKTCGEGGELRQCPSPLHCDFLQVALVTRA